MKSYLDSMLCLKWQYLSFCLFASYAVFIHFCFIISISEMCEASQLFLCKTHFYHVLEQSTWVIEIQHDCLIKLHFSLPGGIYWYDWILQCVCLTVLTILSFLFDLSSWKGHVSCKYRKFAMLLHQRIMKNLRLLPECCVYRWLMDTQAAQL